MLIKRGVILGAAAILLAATGGGLYWYGTKSPLYSLWQAQRAFRHHHLTAFQKYVDSETLTGRMIDQMTAANAEAAEKTGNLWDQLVQKLAQGLAPALKPQLVKRLKEQLEAYVVTGKFEVNQSDSDKEFFTLEHLYQMGGGERVELRGIAFVKTEQQTAVVGLALRHKVHQTPLLLELKLEERGGYWQVVGFNNLPEYLEKLTAVEAKPGSNTKH
jgi:hypothetical protein